MNSIRIKFIRGEEVKYISHLDLMKVFDRAMRRANIPIGYSQGFNPHPQMVFGLPLSVGVTSEAEYADFEFSSVVEPEKFIKLLGSNLPAGLIINQAKYLKTKSNIMKEISMAKYDLLVSTKEDPELSDISAKINELLGQSEIKVIKEGKKGKKEMDIKPMIHGISLKSHKTGEAFNINFENASDMDFGSGSWVLEYADVVLRRDLKENYKKHDLFTVSILLSAGSVANLKPEFFISALNEKYDVGFKIYKIHRTGLYVTRAGRICDPLNELALS